MLVSISGMLSMECQAFTADAGLNTLGENSGDTGASIDLLDASARLGVLCTATAAGSGVGGRAYSLGCLVIAPPAATGEAGAGAGDAGGVANDVGTGSFESEGSSVGRALLYCTVAVASAGAVPDAFATRINPAPFASFKRFLIHRAKSTGGPVVVGAEGDWERTWSETCTTRHDG